ncbi:MAG: MMPL family transporter [Bacteroidetes bacterium]|nr:MMPL family transporter [Bacteroidota bacterium]
MWANIARLILRNRPLFLGGLLLLTAFMAWQGRKIEMSYNYAQVIPEDNQKRIEYNHFKELFGEEGNILTLAIQTDSLYKFEVFQDWYKLGNDIKSIDGVSDVISLAHIYTLEKNDSLKNFALKPIVSKTPVSQLQVDSIKSVIAALPFYEGLLYNSETGATLMAITLEQDYLDSRKRIRLVDAVREEGELFSKTHKMEVHYSGLPFIRTIIATKLAQEMRKFLIYAMIITALVLLFLFRSIFMVIFPLMVVCMGVIACVGIIVLLGFKVNILTGLIPPLIIVIGIPNCIYLLNRYHIEFKKHGNKIKSLQRVIEKIGVAAFFTNLTTAVGFGVFSFTDSKILVEFGIVSSISIMATFLISLIFIPIVFSVLPDPTKIQVRYLDSKIINGIISYVESLIRRHHRAIYIVTGCLIIASIIGIFNIKAEGYIADDIPHEEKEYSDLKFLEKHFNGVMPFEIVLDMKEKGEASKLATMMKIEQMQLVLSEYDELSKSLSVAEGMKFINQSYYNGNPKRYKLPNEFEKQFVLPYLARFQGDSRLLTGFMDSTRRYTRISMQIADIGSKKLPIFLDDLESKLSVIMNGIDATISYTGTSVVFLEGNNYLIKSLLFSLIIAFILIAIIMGLLFRSIKMILISMVPNLIPLLITAGIMGYFNVALKPSTVLVFSIAFGIAVDTSIHFLTKYRQEIYRHDWDIAKTVSVSLHNTGRSIIYTTMILFFGFVIFTLSDFGGTVFLGMLTSITLVVAMLTNIILLPSLLLSVERSIKREAIKEPFLQVYEEEEEDIELEKLTIK